MQFLSFHTVKTIEVTGGSCEITRRSGVTSRKPCNITSCPVFFNVTSANHATCSFIDSSGYVSGPIRSCLILDYIINENGYLLIGLHGSQLLESVWVPLQSFPQLCGAGLLHWRLRCWRPNKDEPDEQLPEHLLHELHADQPPSVW